MEKITDLWYNETMIQRETTRNYQEYGLQPDVFDDASILAITSLTGFVEPSPVRRTIEANYERQQTWDGLGARALAYDELIQRSITETAWDEAAMIRGYAPTN